MWLARVLVGPDPSPSTYVLARRFFLRALGLIFFAAFLSFWVQARALIGSHGIVPIAEQFGWLRGHTSALEGFFDAPGVFWLSSSDAALTIVCALGTLLSVALVYGLAPRWVTLALWALYLSIVSVGYVFMGYQWDILLLEVSLLAVFFAPGGLLPFRRKEDPGPGRASLWLLRWLLFRLMFMSGMVKLLSHDPAWRDLSALQYHYWTQPLPVAASWYAAQLPASVQKLCCAWMFVIELGVPFLIFCPRRVRHAGAAALAFLQLVILSTGNYGFFNWLTIALCVPLLDDRAILFLLPKRFRPALPVAAAAPPPVPWRRWTFGGVVAACFFLLGGAEMAHRLWRRHRLPVLEGVLEAIAPFRSINSYGLFAVMTTERPEIQLEGSADGEHWEPYVFKWKPGPLDRAPGFVAPHQPRLDWQMWFAALESCRENPWFLQFQQRLLEGNAEVLRLLEKNPFPAAPPRYLRSMLYQYRFATPEEHRQGLWWQRDPAGTYCPPLTLKDGQLEVAP